MGTFGIHLVTFWNLTVHVHIHKLEACATSMAGTDAVKFEAPQLHRAQEFMIKHDLGVTMVLNNSSLTSNNCVV